jgi:Ferric reductase like transmembrane component
VHGQLWWYVARAGGLVSWALLAGSTLVGLLLSTRAVAVRATAAWVTDLHRGLGALAVAFVGVHLSAVWLDGFVRFSLADLFVPMRSSWHPASVVWGIVGFYLLVAVEATSLARRWLPHRWWRRMHLASFPLFVVATVHGLLAGTDRANAVMIGVFVATSMSVAFLATARLVSPTRAIE